MQRRNFIHLAAAGAAQAFQSKPLGIGFLGLSHVHAAAKLAAVQALPQYRVVGVCDTKARAGTAPLLSRADLLARPDVQVIAVESEVRDHAADGLAVLQAGKHLHLEKSPADTLAPVQRIAAMAREKRLVFQTGYMWRYNPGIVKALEAARSGELGDIYEIRAVINNQMNAEARATIDGFRGGIMFELAGHLIDPVVRLMGRPRKVTPFVHRDGKFSDQLNDHVVAVIEWERAIATIHCAALQPDAGRFRTLEIYGTRGAAILNPIEQPVLTVKGQRQEFPKYSRYVEDFVNLAAVIRGEARLPVTLDEEVLVQDVLLRCSGMEG